MTNTERAALTAQIAILLPRCAAVFATVHPHALMLAQLCMPITAGEYIVQAADCVAMGERGAAEARKCADRAQALPLPKRNTAKWAAALAELVRVTGIPAPSPDACVAA